MFQKIYSGFVIGETYYVKTIKGKIVGDVIFDNYIYSKTCVWFRDIVGHCGYLFQLNEINIYRYVSEEEYYEKLKEKYDLHCLNSVLKRVIDETFEW